MLSSVKFTLSITCAAMAGSVMLLGILGANLFYEAPHFPLMYAVIPLSLFTCAYHGIRLAQMLNAIGQYEAGKTDSHDLLPYNQRLTFASTLWHCMSAVFLFASSANAFMSGKGNGVSLLAFALVFAIFSAATLILRNKESVKGMPPWLAYLIENDNRE